jgi:hypothetical protein
MVHSRILRRYAVLVALLGVAAPMPPAAMADVCAYVASVTADQIAVLDVTNRRVAGAIPAPGAARSGVTLDGAGRAYVVQDGDAGGAAVATVIDTATHAVVARVTLPSCAYGRVLVDTARGRLLRRQRLRRQRGRARSDRRTDPAAPGMRHGRRPDRHPRRVDAVRGRAAL